MGTGMSESHKGGYHARENILESFLVSVPVAQSRDGQDKVEELHTALTIVGELYDGEDHAKASYHGEGRDREPLPESPRMETAKSESPTRENAIPIVPRRNGPRLRQPRSWRRLGGCWMRQCRWTNPVGYFLKSLSESAPPERPESSMVRHCMKVHPSCNCTMGL